MHCEAPLQLRTANPTTAYQSILVSTRDPLDGEQVLKLWFDFDIKVIIVMEMFAVIMDMLAVNRARLFLPSTCTTHA